MRADFERTVWPVLTGRSPFALILHRPALFSAYTIVDQAIRMALWDLMAQSVELPLYQFLGALSQNNRVRAYGSGLDFHFSEEDAVAQYRRIFFRKRKIQSASVGADAIVLRKRS